MRAPKRSRKFRIVMTVDEVTMPVIFDLVRNEATDFHVKEILDQPDFGQPGVNPPTAGQVRVAQQVPPQQQPFPARRRNPGGFTTQEAREKWTNQFWPAFEAIMHASPDFSVRYDDPRIINAITSTGRAPSCISPVWSNLVRSGKVERIAKGMYRLAGRGTQL